MYPPGDVSLVTPIGIKQFCAFVTLAAFGLNPPSSSWDSYSSSPRQPRQPRNPALIALFTSAHACNPFEHCLFTVLENFTGNPAKNIPILHCSRVDSNLLSSPTTTSPISFALIFSVSLKAAAKPLPRDRPRWCLLIRLFSRGDWRS